jgi:addiction module RelB/DinJ family antitoxin
LDNTFTVANAPKTGTFQMRINPEIKAQVEQIYARCGMTMTDAINAFLQQSINVEGLPFLMTQNSKEALREQAIAQLMLELKKGEDSVQSEADWVSEDELLHEFGVVL